MSNVFDKSWEPAVSMTVTLTVTVSVTVAKNPVANIPVPPPPGYYY